MFEIYFNDLNEECKLRFLDYLNITVPDDANFDTDILPIAIIEIEQDDEGQDE
jgi:hypothetical protein